MLGLYGKGANRVGVALCLLLIVGTRAFAMTVEPVVVDLKPGGHRMSETVTVQNTFTTPLPVALSVQSLKFDPTGAVPTGKDPGDLVIFPPQALIPPGQTQAFRIQWVGNPALPESQHYYVTVAQLPVKLPQGQSAIQILYNFRVLVNVGAAHGKADLSVTKAEIAMADVKPPAGKTGPVTKQPEPEVVIRNAGPNYGYLSRTTLEIVQKDPSGKEIFDKTLSPQDIQQTVGFGLIGPETSRELVIPVALPSAEGNVEVRVISAGDQP